MSSFAARYGYVGRARPNSASRRRPVRVAVPWAQVKVARIAGGRPNVPPGNPVLIGVLALVAIAAHVGLVWYVIHHVRPAPVTKKHEVSVEFVTPPKPLPPKIEPPKPPPPKPVVQRPSLPQIQTATPDAQSVSAAPNDVPAVAAPQSAPPAAPPAAPEVVTAPFGRAGYLNNPPPEYPAAAARQSWEGTVLLRVRVLSTGKVDSIEVQKSSGHKVLDEAARDTVRAWLFSPSKRGSTPIDGWATVPIEFKLDT